MSTPSGAYGETGRWEQYGFCATCGYPRTEAGMCVDEPSHAATDHRATIFAEGDYQAGTLTWGWDCSACEAWQKGYGNATTAREHADNHEALA